MPLNSPGPDRYQHLEKFSSGLDPTARNQASIETYNTEIACGRENRSVGETDR
jgi:hypothetical protein